MTILNSTRATITTDTYQVQVNNETYTYIEYLNDKNKVIDCNLRDESGNEIAEFGPELLEQIRQAVDEYNKI